MLVKLLTKLCGGIWRLKARCQGGGNPHIRRLALALYKQALQAKGSWISHEAEFKTVPLFPHGIYGIFISGGVSIGEHCIIFQHVTIGSNTLIDSSRLGAPTIGNNCYIGAGAKIIGNVRVGDDVRIGANAVVAKDVPANSIVISGEQKVITQDHPLANRFYQNNGRHWRYFERGVWAEVIDSNELKLLRARFPNAPTE